MKRTPDRTLDALERVYRSQFNAMLRTGTAFLGDVDAARDALQEGVADAIRTRRSFRGEGTLEAWLWAIVLNAIRDAYRDRTRTTELETPADHAERAEVATTNGRAAAASVRDAVRRLPQRQRLVLFLRVYADMDYATIATLLGIREGTVAASLNAARGTLRSLLKEVRA